MANVIFQRMSIYIVYQLQHVTLVGLESENNFILSAVLAITY